MIRNIEIKQNEKYPYRSSVYLDGKKINGVISIDYNYSVDTLPVVTLDIARNCIINQAADVEFDYSPDSVKEACTILREELMKHGEIYRGFCASIKSALNDSPEAVFANDDEMAELIVRRIIGDD